jgi:hypothetical protein
VFEPLRLTDDGRGRPTKQFLIVDDQHPHECHGGTTSIANVAM